MRARLAPLLAIVLVTMMLLAAPALAAKGGQPTESSCGLGEGLAQEAVADEVKKAEGPGATEYARIPPSEAECLGKE